MLLENTEVKVVLAKFSVNVPALETSLVNHINDCEPIQDGDGEVFPESSPILERVFRQAYVARFNKTAECEPLSVIDILLSLVADGETAAANIFSNKGITLKKLLYTVRLGIDLKRF